MKHWILVVNAWHVIGRELEKNRIKVIGLYNNGKICEYKSLKWSDIDFNNPVHLYAGDICDEHHMADANLYGLSICKTDNKHLYHDITWKYPLEDNTVDLYQAEDVLEYIDYELIPSVIDEIYRIMKPGTTFRICLPDYNSPYLKEASMFSDDGIILFDPTGGGQFEDGRVQNGGHVWFPTINNVRIVLNKTKYKNIEYLCYWENGISRSVYVIDKKPPMLQ